MKFVFTLRHFVLKYIIAITLLVVVVKHYDLIEYGLRMGQGQLSILTSSKKIEKYLEDPDYPDSLKQKIRLITEIKQFTVDKLGFQPSPNYTKLYDQKGKPVMYVVTGSEKYALVPKMWKFPVVGEVTYKGFFSKEEAETEAENIRTRGYETRIRIVNAWSTLGWFNDPIMSSMLEESPGDIAEVIIHELSHGTIFIKNKVELSENLANFIGDKGARLFLVYKYGEDSKEYRDYVENTSDYEKFTLHFLAGAKRLDSLYSSRGFAALDTLQKNEVKNAYIRQIVDGLDTIPFFHPEYYTKRYEKNLPNNATFIVFRQYNSMQDDFEKEFMEKGEGDLKKYVDYLIRKYNK